MTKGLWDDRQDRKWNDRQDRKYRHYEFRSSQGAALKTCLSRLVIRKEGVRQSLITACEVSLNWDAQFDQIHPKWIGWVSARS